MGYGKANLLTFCAQSVMASFLVKGVRMTDLSAQQASGKRRNSNSCHEGMHTHLSEQDTSSHTRNSHSFVLVVLGTQKC